VRVVPYIFLEGRTINLCAQISRKGNISFVEVVQYGFDSSYNNKRTIVHTARYNTHFKAWHNFRGAFNA
jgi:hypothetical protein